MNDIEKIKCIEELNKRKKQLQFELIATNKKIDALEKNCNHLNANLGQDKYRCILCEKENSKTGYIINAEKYLLHYDIDDRFECNKKFEVIKTLTKKIMQENPEMTREEIVALINNFIQENVSIKVEKPIQKIIKRK